MTKGEVFLEYIAMRQEQRLNKAKQQAEEEANKNATDETAA